MDKDPILSRQELRRVTESQIFMRIAVGLMVLMSMMTESREFRFITAGLAIFLIFEKSDSTKVESGTVNFEYPPEIE